MVPALGDNYGPYVPVTTPEEAWPITGLADYPLDTSIRIGLRELEREMANYPDQPLLIFGYSQSSMISVRTDAQTRRAVSGRYRGPGIRFVLMGVLNVPNGGVNARFPGLYIPIINWYFNGPMPTDALGGVPSRGSLTGFVGCVVSRQKRRWRAPR